MVNRMSDGIIPSLLALVNVVKRDERDTQDGPDQNTIDPDLAAKDRAVGVATLAQLTLKAPAAEEDQASRNHVLNTHTSVGARNADKEFNIFGKKKATTNGGRIAKRGYATRSMMGLRGWPLGLANNSARLLRNVMAMMGKLALSVKTGKRPRK